MRIRALEIQLRDFLRAQLDDQKIQVDLLAGDIRSFRPTRPNAVMLQYKGSGFSSPRPAQQRRLRFEVYIGCRSLRDDGNGGAIDMLDDLRDILANYRFGNLGANDVKLFIEAEDALFYDEKTSTFWFYSVWAANTTWVK